MRIRLRVSFGSLRFQPSHDIIRHPRGGQRCSGKSAVILSGKCQEKVLLVTGSTLWVGPAGVTLSVTTPFHVLSVCPLEWCVFLCFMLQSQCHLIRASRSTHSSYPHNPPGRRSSPGSAAVARCCFISLTPGIDGAYSHSSITETYVSQGSLRRSLTLFLERE